MEGNTSQAMAVANATANKVIRKVSPMNCMMRFLRLLPNTLRTPTSLARFTACAVARLMKLTQAMIRQEKTDQG